VANEAEGVSDSEAAEMLKDASTDALEDLEKALEE
jgi:hypothetical protein